MDLCICFILWVIIQNYLIFQFKLSSFDHWEHFELAPVFILIFNRDTYNQHFKKLWGP